MKKVTKDHVLEVIKTERKVSRESIAKHLHVDSKDIKAHLQALKAEGIVSVEGDRRGARYTLSTLPGVILTAPDPQRPRMDINKRFEMMLVLVKAMVKGDNNSLIITGQSGTGKTSSVLEALKDLGLEARLPGQVCVPEKHFLHVKGASSATELYRIFFEHYESIIVFDDCDSVFNDGNGMNVLKAVLDTFPERTVSWISNYVQKTLGLPESYTFKGKVIFVTNKAKVDPALMSRGLNVDLNMSLEELCDRMDNLGPRLNEELSEKEHQELIEFMRENALKFTDFSLRTYIKIANLITSGVAEWKELALWSN